MFAFLLPFLATKLGKAVALIVAILFLLGLAWGALKWHDHNVAEEARRAFNEQQIALVLKEQAEFKKKTDELLVISRTISTKLDQQNSALDVKFKSIDDYLNTPEVKSNAREVSPVITETLKRLGAPK